MSVPNGWAAPGDRETPAAPAPSAPTSASPSEALSLPAPDAASAPASQPAAAALKTPLADADLLGGDIPFRPLSISEMLDGAIACIRRHPRATLGLSIAVSTVIQVTGSLLAYYFIGPEAREELTPSILIRTVGTQFVLGAIGLVLSAYGILLLAGLLAPLLGRGLLGMPTSLRRAWRDARPRMARLAGVAAVIMTCSLAALALPSAPLLILVAVEGPVPAIIIAGMLGIPLGLAAMTWVYVLLVLAAPAVVMERESVGGALRRARALSRARWWRTCGTLLLALMITVFMGLLALRVPFLFVQVIVFGDAEGTGATAGALAVDTLGRIVSWSVVLPFDAGVIALLYVDRRMRREGFDLDLRTRARPAAQGGAPAASAPADGRADEVASDDGFFDLWRPDPIVARARPSRPPKPPVYIPLPPPVPPPQPPPQFQPYLQPPQAQPPAPPGPPAPQAPQQPPQTWTST